MQDSLSRQWHYLGFAYFETQNAAALATALCIKTTPSDFHDFIHSCTLPTRAKIFSNTPQIPAILHVLPEEDNILDEDDMNNFLQEVTLCFEYSFIIDIPIIGGKFYVTPRNAQACYSDFCNLGLALQDKSPDFSVVIMAPFLGGSHYGHGVDLQVCYRWTQSPNNSNEMVLRIRIDQDPIPKIPPDAPPPETVEWKLLGTPIRVIWHLEKLFNELLLAINVLEFVQSVPEGQIRDDFYRGKGIRASNVYTPATVLQGLQVKVKFEDGFFLVSISIGSLLETNPGFSGRMIEVYYRWRGVALELMVQLAAAQV